MTQDMNSHKVLLDGSQSKGVQQNYILGLQEFLMTEVEKWQLMMKKNNNTQ